MIPSPRRDTGGQGKVETGREREEEQRETQTESRNRAKVQGERLIERITGGLKDTASETMNRG